MSSNERARNGGRAASTMTAVLRRWPIGLMAAIISVLGFFAFAIIDSFRGEASIGYRMLRATGLHATAYAGMSEEEIRERLTELLDAEPDFSHERPVRRRYRISGCLVFETQNWGVDACDATPPINIWKMERRIDLSLIETNPAKRGLRPIADGDLRAMLEMPYREEVVRDLRQSYDRYHIERRRLLAEEEATGVFDLRERVRRMRQFAQDELADGLFFRNARRVYYCEQKGLTAMTPADPDRARIPGRHLELAEVSELLDIYAQRLCDPTAK